MAKKTTDKTEETKTEEVVVEETKTEETKITDVAETEQTETTNKQETEVPLKENDRILVKSVTKGSLSLTDNNKKYYWKEYGSSIRMKFEDLQNLRNGIASNYFTKPLFIIEDMRAVRELDLESVYEDFNLSDLSMVYNLKSFIINSDSKTLVNKISKLPNFLKEALRHESVDLFKKGDLYDRNKIKVLSDELNIDFTVFED